MKAPGCIRRRRFLARIDGELEALRASIGGAGLAVYASNGYDPVAVGSVLGWARRIRHLEGHRARIAGVRACPGRSGALIGYRCELPRGHATKHLAVTSRAETTGPYGRTGRSVSYIEWGPGEKNPEPAL